MASEAWGWGGSTKEEDALGWPRLRDSPSTRKGLKGRAGDLPRPPPLKAADAPSAEQRQSEHWPRPPRSVMRRGSARPREPRLSPVNPKRPT